MGGVEATFSRVVPPPPSEALIGTIATGVRILFRPIHPEDKDELQKAVARLSPRSRRLRFFAELDRFSEEDLRALTEIDYQDHFAWVAAALDQPGHPGVGVARWIRLRDEPQVAEGAVVVADEWQHRGIGRTLLWLAARSAVERDVRSFRVSVLGDNGPVLELLRRFGARPGRWEAGVVEVEISLTESPSRFDLSRAPMPLAEVGKKGLTDQAVAVPGVGR